MRISRSILGGIVIALVASSGLSAATTQDMVLEKLGHRLFPTLVEVVPNGAPPAVQTMLSQRERRAASCGGEVGCRIAAAAWTDAEIEQVAELAAAAIKGNPSEIRDAVRRELAGLNGILHVYGEGVAPRYLEIDGPGGTGTPQFSEDVAVALASSDAIKAEPVAHLDQSVAFALTLLDGAGRLDAIAFEPLATRENRAAMERASKIAWARYPYTAIIVPGIGPENDLPLSPRSKMNVHMAAARYRAGLAPYIIVTGGAVHPRNTRFVEAVEMRRALIERYDIPQEAILLEPYARHTTTNLRNAARLLFAVHAPEGRPALISTYNEQSAYIEGAAYAERNMRELGYQPGKVGQRTSDNDIAFFPDRRSLRIDPADPLDP